MHLTRRQKEILDFLTRYLDSMDIPKGATRGTLIFAIALLISYLVSLATDYAMR